MVRGVGFGPSSSRRSHPIPLFFGFLGNQPECGKWRYCVCQLKLRLSVLNVVVSELGKMEFGKLVMEECSDIIALTVTTGFRAEHNGLPQTSPFFVFEFGW